MDHVLEMFGLVFDEEGEWILDQHYDIPDYLSELIPEQQSFLSNSC
jgi:hypothetical protein